MSLRTRFLARLFGLFLIVSSAALLVDQPGMSAMLDALVHDRPATFVLALICLAAGLSTVLGHQVWSGGFPQVCVTVLGWLLLLRGVMLLFLPANLLQSLVDTAAGPVMLHTSGAIGLGIGLCLAYAAFRTPPILPARQ